MEYQNPDYLLSPQQLNCKLADQGLRLFDVTVYLRPQQTSTDLVLTAHSGLPEYERAHLPGAGFMDQLSQLSVAGAPLRFTLPPVTELAAEFAAAGISFDSDVVLYSSGHFMWATRAWWLLRYCGHNRVSVLDGGLAGWTDAGLPVDLTPHRYPAGDFASNSQRCRAAMFADLQQVADAMEQDNHCTINALPEAMYDGSSPIQYGRPGHIPGSTNLPYSKLMQTPDVQPHAQSAATFELPLETLLPAADMHQALTDGGLLGSQRVITYCGGGIAATVPAFASALMGQEHIAVYDGSMSEWSTDPQRPLITGSSA